MAARTAVRLRVSRAENSFGSSGDVVGASARDASAVPSEVLSADEEEKRDIELVSKPGAFMPTGALGTWLRISPTTTVPSLVHRGCRPSLSCPAGAPHRLTQERRATVPPRGIFRREKSLLAQDRGGTPKGAKNLRARRLGSGSQPVQRRTFSTLGKRALGEQSHHGGGGIPPGPGGGAPPRHCSTGRRSATAHRRVHRRRRHARLHARRRSLRRQRAPLPS